MKKKWRREQRGERKKVKKTERKGKWRWSEKERINTEGRRQMKKKGKGVSGDGEKTYPQHHTQWNKHVSFQTLKQTSWIHIWVPQLYDQNTVRRYLTSSSFIFFNLKREGQYYIMVSIIKERPIDVRSLCAQEEGTSPHIFVPNE